ncbi:SMI1/KNR4 family protein [Agromyces sp. NPDC004153]
MNDEQSRSDGVGWAVLLDRPEVSTRPAATDAEVNAAEVELATRFPIQLRQLFMQTDGVWDRSGRWFVIWPLVDLVERNSGTAEERAAIAFGDDGTGNPFCVHRDGTVSYWSEIDAEHTFLSPDLTSFWTAWLRDDLRPH